MVVKFEINGHTFTALNGGPVRCETQAEVDYYWGKLTQDGKEAPCGWLKEAGRAIY